jgi:hypothetical protein
MKSDTSPVKKTFLFLGGIEEMIEDSPGFARSLFKGRMPDFPAIPTAQRSELKPSIPTAPDLFRETGQLQHQGFRNMGSDGARETPVFYFLFRELRPCR